MQLSLVEEQFDIPTGFQGDNVTPIATLTQDFKVTSQSLLRRYVQTESYTLVQVIEWFPWCVKCERLILFSFWLARR